MLILLHALSTLPSIPQSHPSAQPPPRLFGRFSDLRPCTTFTHRLQTLTTIRPTITYTMLTIHRSELSLSISSTRQTRVSFRRPLTRTRSMRVIFKSLEMRGLRGRRRMWYRVWKLHILTYHATLSSVRNIGHPGAPMGMVSF